MSTEQQAARPDPDRPLPVPARRRHEKRGPFAFVAPIAIPLLGLVAKLRFVDAEKVPATGAFVLSPNHYSNIDPIVMGVALYRMGRNPRFLAKAGLFRVPVLGALLRRLGQIPVERGQLARGADPIGAAEALAAAGAGVVVYPEGSLTRDPDLWPMRGKSGAVRIAIDAGIPLVPAVHWGTNDLMPRYSSKLRFFPRAQITVKVGDPVDLSAFRGKPLDAAALSAATELVMAEITRLLAEVRGEEPPAERWDPSAHGQTETGRF